jgi:hypothetical protein
MLFLILLSLGGGSPLLASIVTTLNVTPLLYNNSFDIQTSVSSAVVGWTVLTTLGMTEIESGTSTDGRNVARLKALYSNSSIAVLATLQTWDNIGTTSAYHSIDFSTTSPPTVHDAIIVKVWAKGSGIAAFGNGTVTGSFSVLLQSALSLSTVAVGASYNGGSLSLFRDMRVTESEGFKALGSDGIFGVMTTWNVFTFTFTPPGYCDWWQIRNLQLNYLAAANQPFPTELVIDRVELYTIRIDDQ